MQIETKHNIGDTVYWCTEVSTKKAVVTAINCFVLTKEPREARIEYRLADPENLSRLIADRLEESLVRTAPEAFRWLTERQRLLLLELFGYGEGGAHDDPTVFAKVFRDTTNGTDHQQRHG